MIHGVIILVLTVVQDDIYPAPLEVLDDTPDLLQIVPQDELGLIRLTCRAELLKLLNVRVR
jgi:hypothetical protein